MSTTTLDAGLAYRGDGTDRPAAVPAVPERTAVLRGGRLRKYWRYVGVWSPTVSVCAARVRVGPLSHEFWAVWDTTTGRLRQAARMTAGRVQITPDRVRIRDRDVAIDLQLTAGSGAAFEVVSPVERAWTWTRKTCTRATGTIRLGERRLDVDAAAMLEENGGYHPRRTHWWWSAGAGTLTDGRQAMWNAVVGLNDAGPHHENTVWIDGVAHQTGTARISADLSTTRFDDGSALHFTSTADRRTVTDLLLLRSEYRAPFGTFAGTLPGGLELRDGCGVMEDHHALW